MKKQERKNDFTISDLPMTYPALWRDGVKQRCGTLLLFGAISLASLLPGIGILLWEDIYSFQLSDQIEMGQITFEEARILSFWNRNIAGSLFLVAVPLFLIVSFALMRYFRLMSFEEPIFWKEDFFSSLKATWKIGLIYGLIFAILFWVSLFVAGSDISAYLRYIPVVFVFLFIAPTILYSLTLAPYYELPFFGYFIRSVLLYLKHLPISLLFLVGFSLPFALFLVGNPFIRYPILIVYVMLIYPLLMYAWTVYCLSIYDKDINKDDFPDFYRKGLAPLKGEKDGND